MSWRGTAIVAGGVLAAGAVTTGALYGTGTLPLSTQVTAKASGDVSKGPAVPRWDRAGAVLEGAPLARASQPSTDSDVAAALGELVNVPELGGHVGAAVVELGTGSTIYAANAGEAFTPASTMKLLTSVAALDVLGPDYRFTTQVVGGESGAAGEVEITLIGGGDPMLASTDDAAAPGAASLESLAVATAEALGEADVRSVQLSFDDDLFSGPAIDPDWRPSYVPDGVVGPVSALAVDGARVTPGLRERVDDPARYAAEQFASMLEDGGVDVTGGTPQRADGAHSSAPQIAAVTSPRLSNIVEYVLGTSDNDVAETLARHVALGTNRPGTSTDASESVAEALSGLGIDLSGVRILDGSGLARGNDVTVSALVSVLTLAADDGHPQLRPVLSGLPVSGFSGTLAERVGEGGTGYVRAKTGTLTGVHSLAGLVVGADGRGYAFAILADDAADALGARAAIDDFAAALVAD